MGRQRNVRLPYCAYLKRLGAGALVVREYGMGLEHEALVFGGSGAVGVTIWHINPGWCKLVT